MYWMLEQRKGGGQEEEMTVSLGFCPNPANFFSSSAAVSQTSCMNSNYLLFSIMLGLCLK